MTRVFQGLYGSQYLGVVWLRWLCASMPGFAVGCVPRCPVLMLAGCLDAQFCCCSCVLGVDFSVGGLFWSTGYCWRRALAGNDTRWPLARSQLPYWLLAFLQRFAIVSVEPVAPALLLLAVCSFYVLPFGSSIPCSPWSCPI